MCNQNKQINMCDEFQVRDLLIEKRKNIKNFDDLKDFIYFIKENCNTDYGVAPRSIAQAAVAVAYFLSDEFGITGFQASAIKWDFLTYWSYRNNKCGLKIVNYDDMLYPQYKDDFDKKIALSIWKNIQEEAENNLKKYEGAAPQVKEHWENIVNGIVPFGYTVKEDN